MLFYVVPPQAAVVVQPFRPYIVDTGDKSGYFGTPFRRAKRYRLRFPLPD